MAKFYQIWHKYFLLYLYFLLKKKQKYILMSYLEIRSKRIVTTASSKMQPEVRFSQATIDSVSITFPWVIIASDRLCVAREERETLPFRLDLFSFLSRSCHYKRTICLRRWTNGPLSRKFLDRGPRAGNRPSKPHPYVAAYVRCNAYP